MRLFKRRTSADLEDPQLTGLRYESPHREGETQFVSSNDDNISIATAPTPEPRLIMSHSPRSLKKLSSGNSFSIDELPTNDAKFKFGNQSLSSLHCTH